MAHLKSQNITGWPITTITFHESATKDQLAAFANQSIQADDSICIRSHLCSALRFMIHHSSLITSSLDETFKGMVELNGMIINLVGGWFHPISTVL